MIGRQTDACHLSLRARERTSIFQISHPVVSRHVVTQSARAASVQSSTVPLYICSTTLAFAVLLFVSFPHIGQQPYRRITGNVRSLGAALLRIWKSEKGAWDLDLRISTMLLCDSYTSSHAFGFAVYVLLFRLFFL